MSDIPKHVSLDVFTTGGIAFLFSIAAPMLVVLQSAENGGLSALHIASWIFAIYFIPGIASLIVAIYYKMPLAFAFSLPGAVLIGAALVNHSFTDILGAYVLTGVGVFVLGITGLSRKVMRILPMPIMMGMVSAVFLPFVINIVHSVMELPLLNGLTMLAFLIIAIPTMLARKFPPLLAAMIVAGILIYFFNPIDTQHIQFEMARPQLFLPTIGLMAIVELTVPLIIMIVAGQNIQSSAILKSNGYDSPVNKLDIWCGVTTLLKSVFGGHPTCVPNVPIAITSGEDAGPKEGRYVSAIVLSLLCIACGIMAPFVVVVSQVLPASLIALLGGLALIGVLADAFRKSFTSYFQLGALFAFVITFSGVTIFNIGSPFWGLVGGVIISLLLERNHFAQLKQAA